MIAHVRIPQFYSRTFQSLRDYSNTPVVVVDEGRIIGGSSEALDLGIQPGSLLETTSIPDEAEVFDFDLDAFVTVQNRLYKRAKKTFPIIENFRFGEILCETEDVEDFERWINSNPLNSDLPVAGAISESGWLSRILSKRQSPGTVKTLPAEGYRMALRTVETDEVWGLGTDFISQFQEAELDSFAEILDLDEQTRRKFFGTTSRALNRIFEGGDPNPLNPFGRPRTISQKASFSDRDSTSPDALRSKLEEIVEQFQVQLERIHSLTHQLELVLHFRDRKKKTFQHTFTSPTDQLDVLKVGINSLLSALGSPDQLESAELRANTLVANTRTYHTEAQEEVENLQVL